VKKPNWLRWGSDSTKSDNLKRVRQRTDQMIKRQEAQKELQGDGREKEASREKRLLCNL
jgi:phage shock protein A